jgi:hypothetical protein
MLQSLAGHLAKLILWTTRIFYPAVGIIHDLLEIECSRHYCNGRTFAAVSWSLVDYWQWG